MKPVETTKIAGLTFTTDVEALLGLSCTLAVQAPHMQLDHLYNCTGSTLLNLCFIHKGPVHMYCKIYFWYCAGCKCRDKSSI